MFARSPHRPPALRFALCLLMLPLSLPRAALGSEGLPIHSVEVEGLQQLPRETVLHYLGLAAGQTFSRAELNDGIRRLWSSELVDDVGVEVLSTAERLSAAGARGPGVRLVVRVVERPLLVSLSYDGLHRLGRQEISDLVDRKRIQLYEGGPLDLGEVTRLERALETLYHEKGFPLAAVRFELEPLSESERRVVFKIDEGEQIKIAEIRFDGNAAVGEDRLRRAMKHSRASGLVSRLRKRDVFKTAQFQNDLEAVRRVYAEAGYKDAVVGEPELEVVGKPPQEERRLVITIPVEEGERFSLGEITVTGNEALSDQVLLRIIEAPWQGRTRWLSSKHIDQAKASVRDLYHSQGYLAAEVAFEVRERAQGVADLIVHLEEGDVYTVGRVEIRGNKKTRDRVVRREIRVREGAVLDTQALRRSLVKIEQLGFFQPDPEEPVRLRFDDEKNVVDIVVQGEEAKKTQFQFGASWDPQIGIGGILALSTDNLLGRGESLGFSLSQGGGPQDSYSIFYNVPWLLDRPQSVGTSVFQQRLSFPSVVGSDSILEETGVSLSYGRSLGVFESLTLTFEQKETRQSFFDELVPFGSRFQSTSLGTRYVYDSRTSPLHPSHGMRVVGGVTYTGGALGGDRSLVRPEAGFQLFRPLTRSRLRSVFAFNTQGGWIAPFEGQGLHPLEGFFLGGPSSVRGFRPSSLFSRDEAGEPLFENDLALGGDKYFQLNLEYHLLLGGPVRLVLYGDAGNAFAPRRSLDLSKLRYTTGAELRLTVPALGAPLRFIYAINLDPLPSDQFESFRFTFGTSF